MKNAGTHIAGEESGVNRRSLPPVGASVGRIANLSARSGIFREGEEASYIYDVLKGAVTISKAMPDGRRQIVEVLGPGSLFGMTFSDVYRCQADALTDVRLRRIRRQNATDSKELQHRLFRQYSQELDDVRTHALLLGRKSAMERVASFLLSLPSAITPSDYRAAKTFEPERVTTMTQREIGDYLGLKIETVSRNITLLKQRMIIAKGKRGHFHLLDIGALQRLACPS
jgi:CRP/FNR family transcriptional regulator, nitrogen fixation regulation protein